MIDTSEWRRKHTFVRTLCLRTRHSLFSTMACKMQLAHLLLVYFSFPSPFSHLFSPLSNNQITASCTSAGALAPDNPWWWFFYPSLSLNPLPLAVVLHCQRRLYHGQQSAPIPAGLHDRGKRPTPRNPANSVCGIDPGRRQRERPEWSLGQRSRSSWHRQPSEDDGLTKPAAGDLPLGAVLRPVVCQVAER